MMLNKTAKRIVDKLLRHNVIPKDSEDIYVYGFELLLSFLFSTTIIVLIGCILRKLPETLVFLAVFILLRSFSGGYHAQTYAKCSFVTFSVYGAVLLFSSFLSVGWIAYLLLFLGGVVILWIKAPVENPNKHLTAAEKKKHKITSILLFILFCICGIGFNVGFPSIGATVWSALFMDLTLMFFKSNYRKEFHKDESH